MHVIETYEPIILYFNDCSTQHKLSGHVCKQTTVSM